MAQRLFPAPDNVPRSQLPDTDLLVRTEQGLYCPTGGFHIDPWEPVERALVTHAHADHARWGCDAYLAAAPGEGVLRIRMGADATIETLPYGAERRIGGVTVSFHPAGHLLGSAQIRITDGTTAWVVSGDYKTDADPTCAPFEPVLCDVFISECTFGLPIYRWPAEAEVFEELHAWWRGNQEAGRTSVVYAYALGKAQRVLAGLEADAGPILLHGAVHRLTEAYRASGVRLPAAEYASAEAAKRQRGRALVIAPPSAGTAGWLRKFGQVSDAFASGWMRIRGVRRRRNVDRGFVLSDHADWDGLLTAIEATGADRIGVTHGYVEPMARWLRASGRDAFILRTRWEGELDGGGPDTETEESDAPAPTAPPDQDDPRTPRDPGRAGPEGA